MKIIKNNIITLIVFVFSTLNLFSQQNKITGKVSGQSGSELPGVSILVKGTINGTSTDFDGNYTINTDSNALLIISYIGFVTQEVSVTGRSVINITLKDDLENLDEVVIVGYGTARKGDLTGSISTVSTKNFDKIASSSPLQILQGRATGLSITSSSGVPGSGSNVLIRGVGSINGSSSPIYVVDGVIKTNINNLNPNTIESISVLKDASAAAIYGARAANGVILVSLKRGKGSGASQITFNTYVGIQTESNLKLDLLNADQFVELWTESHENIGLESNWTQADLDQYSGVDTDWKDAMLQTGIIQNYDLSVSGGNEDSNYFVSGNYFTQEGMVIKTAYEKFNLTLNSDHKINDWLKWGNSILLYSSKTEGDGTSYNLAMRKSPLTRVYEEDGSWGIIRNQALEHIHKNPVWQSENYQNDNLIKGLQGSLYVTLNLLEGLEFTARGSIDYVNSYSTLFNSGVPDPARYSWEGSTINLVQKQNIQSTHGIVDFLLNYKTSINEDHNITVLLGYSREENERELLYASIQGTPNDDIRYLDAGDPETMQNSNNFRDWSFASIFSRATYNYKNKYYFNATIRRDGTSRLTEENRYGVFPSGSIGWKISEEDFFNKEGFFNNLKLRASMGILGNVLSLSEYATISSLSFQGRVLNDVVTPGYTQTSAVNTDITWETSQKCNFGFDATMVNGKIYTSVDYFIESTSDQLFTQPIPLSNGYFSSPIINAGEVRNTGIELQLGIRNNHSKDWSYDVNFNFSSVKNEVTDLGGRDEEFLSSGLKVGEPVNSFFGYKTNGLITDESQLAKYQGGSFGSKAIGDINIVDISGFDDDGKPNGIPDGIINAADRTIIGSRFPKFIYGMTGTLNYKNWGLQVQLQGVQGRDIYIGSRNSNDLMVLMSSWARNEDARIYRRYHPINNPNGTWPRLTKDGSGANLEVSDFWLEDASYLRINNINLSYNVSGSLLNRFDISNLSLYSSVNNLYTFTKYGGPEVDTTAGGPNSVNALSGIPSPTTFNLGLKVSL
ncbi:TonB-dependent receptor [Flavicella sp.]|uniref:SusC/RagA family TonB-linked outer membrane protein n=1 Tax=Flavicella sp. TaxID=2957742 RepID=UPI00301A97C0